MEADSLKSAKLKNIENWSVWKFQVRVLLISREVFGVLNGTESKPTAPPADAAAAEKKQYEKHLNEFQEKIASLRSLSLPPLKDNLWLI